jgi:hypothetical protein
MKPGSFAYSVFHMNGQQKMGFSTRRFKGTMVQRPICKGIFDVIKTVSPSLNYHEFGKSVLFFEGETSWKHSTLA